MSANQAVCAVILAAGRGQRLGGVAKALLPSGTMTFLERVIRTLADGGACGQHRVVVGPPFGDRVAAHAAELDGRVVRNPQPDRGMASSVAVGFQDLLDTEEPAIAALLWPVDHPDVSAATVARLCEAAQPDRIVVPRNGGRGGHPALIGRTIWPEMARCDGEPEGARSVVRRDRQRLAYVDTGDRGVIVDIDTADDLQAERA